jgi:hypothetical protein
MGTHLCFFMLAQKRKEKVEGFLGFLHPLVDDSNHCVRTFIFNFPGGNGKERERRRDVHGRREKAGEVQVSAGSFV